MSNKTAETLSMRKFCEQNQLERTKVLRWCKAEDLDTSGGVRDELGRRILAQFQDDEPVEHKEVSIVLHEGMHIDVPSQSKSDEVRAALAIRRAEKPVIAKPILNGQADSLLSDALVLNQAVDAFQAQVEAGEKQLQERFESVEDARELIALNIERITELDAREAKMVSVGLELSEIEQRERETLQDQLKKLLKEQPGNV